MRYFLFFFCVMTAPFFGAQDKDLAKQFQLIVRQSSGVLTDFPEDVRNRRKGPVIQDAQVDKQGNLTIRLTFPCMQDDGGISKASFCAKLHLTSLEAIQLNEHLNTITFRQASGTCNLAFTNLQQLRRAKTILDKLVATAPEKEKNKNFLPSEIAKNSGFTYLIAAPRSDDIVEGTKGLFSNGNAAHNVIWMTKRSLKEVEGLIEESFNRLPIFVYDIHSLDTAPFFTTSIPGSNSLTYIDFQNSLQSVSSSDEKELIRFCKTAAYAGIVFKSDISLNNPLLVICKNEEKPLIQEVSNSPEPIRTAIHSGLFPHPEVPLGTAIPWLTGINDNSYEVLGHCFQTRQITRTLFEGVLYKEFPCLRPLLSTESCYAKNLTKEQAICRSLEQLSALKATLHPDLYTILQVALFSCELGSPFGKDSEIGYNSWPLALTIAEKIGCTELQKGLLEFLICKKSSLLLHRQEKKPSDFAAWHVLAKTAGLLGVPAADLWTLENTFSSIVVQASSPRKKVQKSFKNILCFGIPFGLKVLQGPYPTHSLYSSYLWEARDPKHRDGLSLLRKRTKFEAMQLHNSKAAWKGSFWDWLDRGSALPSTTYLANEKREDYRALFENGRLVHPSLFANAENCELLFVIDDWGRIYVALKKDAPDSSQMSFNHASFFRGSSVASAGKIVFKQGLPVEICDHSGHYRPSLQQIALAVKVLEDHGVDIKHLTVKLKTIKKKWSSGTAFVRHARLNASAATAF